MAYNQGETWEMVLARIPIIGVVSDEEFHAADSNDAREEKTWCGICIRDMSREQLVIALLGEAERNARILGKGPATRK